MLVFKELEEFKAERSRLATQSEQLEGERVRLEGEKARLEDERRRLEEQLRRLSEDVQAMNEQKQTWSENVERNNAKRPWVVQIAQIIQDHATRLNYPYDASI